MCYNFDLIPIERKPNYLTPSVKTEENETTAPYSIRFQVLESNFNTRFHVKSLLIYFERVAYK